MLYFPNLVVIGSWFHKICSIKLFHHARSTSLIIEDNASWPLWNYSVVQKKSSMFEFPAFLQPTNLVLLIHSPTKVLSLGCFEQRFVEVSYRSYWLKKYRYPKSVLDSAVVKFGPIQGTWIFSTNNHCRIPQRIAARSNRGRRRLVA